ncbi:MAG: succinylglutamate desuccinylase [Butyrivibrio sp.]|nr:succinylglutamate desuccinylase [Butyrivibrio sp.]
MYREKLYALEGIYRDEFKITGFRFGQGDKSACVVGSLRGNEYQQMYICSQLIKELKKLEEHGQIAGNKSVLVIPCLNQYATNIDRRFWPLDDSDINRKFPGYIHGDTTQQIAAHIMEIIKGYSYGIQLTSFYMPGKFMPHVRMMETGFQNPSLANLFGLPFAVIRKPKPMDTTTLNYNWQMSGTSAFSLYTPCSDYVDDTSARQAVASILRFLTRMGIIKYNNHSGYIAEVINEDDLLPIMTDTAGFYRRLKEPGDTVYRGDVLGEIIDPYSGEVASKVLSPTEGLIFFAYTEPTVMEDEVVYKVIRRLHE